MGMDNANNTTSNDAVTSTSNADRPASEGGRFLKASAAREYILAGDAEFSIVSRKTGVRFTFRAERPENGAVHFVKLRTGAGERDYTFMGTIFSDGNFNHSRKSRVGYSAPSSVGFRFVWEALRAGVWPRGAEVWHSGRCGRCHRTLTTPESVARGIGPECAKIMDAKAA